MFKTIVSFLIVLFSFNAHSQNNQQTIDSLLIVVQKSKENSKIDSNYVKNLNLISENYFNLNQAKGLFYAKEGMKISKTLNWEKGIALSHLNLGTHYISKAEYNVSEKHLKAAEKMLIAQKEYLLLAKLYNQFGVLNANRAAFSEAISSFFKSLKYCEKIKLNKETVKAAFNAEQMKIKNQIEAKAFLGIANMYNAIENYNKALSYYDKAIIAFKDCPNQIGSIAMCHASKGIVFGKQNRNKEAIKAFQLAEKDLKVQNNKTLLIYINSWMGATYIGLNKYDLSLHYLNKAMEDMYMIESLDLKASTIQNIGLAYVKKGKESGNEKEMDLGFQKINEALALDKKLNSHEGLIKDYMAISEYFYFKKDYKKSLEAYILYSQYKDSIFNFKNKQTLQNLEDKRTIDLKQKEIQLNKVKLEAKENNLLYYIGGILLLSVIAGLLFYQNWVRRKSNEKLYLLNTELKEANKTKLYFFSILNHDLRGPLASLIHFLHLRQNDSETMDEQTKKRLEKTTIENAEHLLESMEDLLLWSKGQMENFKPHPKKINLKILFDEIINHFSVYSNISIGYLNKENVSLFTDEDYLKTIIRNLTANAINALENIENPTIIWNVWAEKKYIYLKISDNGKGADITLFNTLFDDKAIVGIKSGLGLHLIRDLAKIIDCSIGVNSEMTKGTSVTLVFKNLNKKNDSKPKLPFVSRKIKCLEAQEV
ncbi:ATP-binding protein [Flavobacterium suncheonense]|uniref:histidine kinase n=2 Tax=Flavobacterium suncheonense TaxID=350894 RepID=A0A0A2M8D5_9FLAO|nr:tetratricopeptide repeat-containing sensor histidine kinase [Flavobacterium suncheonense]KGO87668.1 hypothetical protein Q764_12430 [Flavobacterium suncheonense GH29-5 = DSM 17707]